MGAALSQFLAPVCITASTARRAQLTLGGLCDGWPALAGLPHASSEALYTFSSADLLAWLAQREPGVEELFIIGHNPAFTDLANWLSAGAPLANLPTAGYVRLALDLPHWSELAPDCAVLQQTLFPKQLPNA